jgi:hypothetical protein
MTVTCNHNWTPWVPIIRRAEGMLQGRHCRKCLKTQRRTV